MTNGVLSGREEEVAQLVAKGLSNKEIGNLLFVTEKTVKFHLTNIYKKERVKSRAQLIVKRTSDGAATTQEDSDEVSTSAGKKSYGLGAQANPNLTFKDLKVNVVEVKSKMTTLIETLLKMQHTTDAHTFATLFNKAMDIVYYVAAQINEDAKTSPEPGDLPSGRSAEA